MASLLQDLEQANPYLDSLTQTVRDSFAMSSKVLDQLGRTCICAYHHFVRCNATMVVIGVNNIEKIAKHVVQLPLVGNGVLGKEFEKLKDRKEKNKE